MNQHFPGLIIRQDIRKNTLNSYKAPESIPYSRARVLHPEKSQSVSLIPLLAPADIIHQHKPAEGLHEITATFFCTSSRWAVVAPSMQAHVFPGVFPNSQAFNRKPKPIHRWSSYFLGPEIGVFDFRARFLVYWVRKISQLCPTQNMTQRARVATQGREWLSIFMCVPARRVAPIFIRFDALEQTSLQGTVLEETALFLTSPFPQFWWPSFSTAA